mgnify:CR=1 FL=1
MKKGSFLSLCASCISLSLVLGACGKKETDETADYYHVDLSEYVCVTVTGYNGYAVATVELDPDKISDLEDELEDEVSNHDREDVPALINSISFTLSDEEASLSNGDTLEIETSYDEDIAEDLEVTFDNASFSYDVKDLDEATAIDPFEGLTLVYSGVSSNGDITFDTTGCDEYVRNELSFSADENYGLSNGDKITVEVYYSQSDLDENSIVLTQVSKDYTVEGLPIIPESLDQVDLSSIQTEMDAQIATSLAADYPIGDTLYAIDGISSPSIWGAKITAVTPSLSYEAYMQPLDLSSSTDAMYVRIYTLRIDLIDNDDSASTYSDDVYICIYYSGFATNVEETQVVTPGEYYKDTTGYYSDIVLADFITESVTDYASEYAIKVLVDNSAVG